MYDSKNKIAFSMKNNTSRLLKFQRFGKEEYTEVSERVILRAVRSTRGGLAGCFGVVEKKEKSGLRYGKENLKTKFNTKFLHSSYDDKTAPEIEHIKQGTYTFIQNVPSRFTVETIVAVAGKWRGG